MLPNNSVEEIKDEVRGYKTFEIDFEKKTIGGLIDGKKALEQAVRIALMTQRYQYAIFSHDYGTDYEGVFSDGYAKAMGRLKKVITESLICDERITAIDSFVFERRGKMMIVKFHVISVYGAFNYETEVEM